MKKLFTIFFLVYAFSLFAQPVNDDCTGLIDLGVVPYCSDSIGVFYTNLDATESNIGNDNIPGPGSCGNNDITFVGNDVWFAFTTSDTILDYTITVTGITDGMGSIPMSNPQIMVYRGDCAFDELALLACGAADDGENVLELDVIGLDPNEIYFIRINDFSTTATPNWGTFQLCVDEIQPINTIDEGGSNLCSGELYDTGGPDEDYMNNENNVFTICPPAPNNACIVFTLQYYNIENGSDVLTFYDGPDINAPVITDLSDGFSANEISGGGGTCMTIQASSGCLTVQFTSDGSTTLEGFAGSWQCSAAPCEPFEFISVDGDVTEQDIIDNVSSPQTIVTVTNISCPNGAYGTFQAGDDTQLGLEKGLVLTCGSINNAIGPNNSNSTTTILGNGGDADLDYLSTVFGNGTTSNDACIVELDVFVATDQLTFEYVFGSEEYPEFVNTNFNDIFAFLISGPGIPGDVNMNNQENIAIIPGSNTPVQINSVNNLLNWEYYRNNEQGVSLEYDGLTSDYQAVKKSLTAQRNVTPCNTYHLKLAIADRGDSSYDSGVFISEIKGGTPNLSVNFASGVDYLVEDCTGTDDELLVTLSNPLDDSISYDVTIGGTAIQGVDYTLNMPSVITLAPGQTQLTYPLIPLSDGLIEGTETIIITLSNNFGCGNINLAQVTVEISDAPIVTIFTGQDTAFVCQNNCITLEVSGATDYFWQPVSAVDDPFSASPESCPTSDLWVSVVGSIGALPGCSAEDSIYLQIIDPQLNIFAIGNPNICVGDSVQLQASNNVNNQGLIWSPGTGLSNINDELVTASPNVTTTYTATVTLAGCSASDDFTVNVDPFDFPIITTFDTTICQGQSIQLAEQIAFTTTTYEWLPDTALEPSNDVSGPLATPLDDITYTLVATSENGYCSETINVDVEVIPAEVSIMPEDTAYICLGESTNLSASTTTGIVTWTPAEGLNNTMDLNVVADPVVSTWYFASMSIGACTVTDSVFVRVDSLPADMSIMAIPDESPYCPGDTVTLYSITYEPNSFPDIEHLWSPPDNAQSEIDNYNFVFITTETLTFYRSVMNNACQQTDSIVINVSPPTTIEISPVDPAICEGESIQLTATSPDLLDFTWTPDNGTLSCLECPDPIATPSGTSTYTVEGELDDCPVEASVQIEVVPNSIAAVIGDTEICIGESIVLNELLDPYPGTTWSWNADPPDPTLDPNDPLAEVTPLETTTYSLTVSNGVCDPLVQQVTITVVQDAILTISEDITICEGDATTLTANSTEPGGTFLWSNGDETASINVSPNDTTEYSVLYSYGCGDLNDSVTVNVIEGADVEILLIDPDPLDTIFEGDMLTLTAVLNGQVNGATYEWSTGQTSQTITTIAMFEPIEYTVTVTSAEGCQYTYSLTVDVLEVKIGVPNVFTPDGDGDNDYFTVFSNGTVNIRQFRVFNRWGQIVYNNETPDQGWDGTYKNENAPSDVYIYDILIEMPSGVIENRKGDLTLLR